MAKRLAPLSETYNIDIDKNFFNDVYFPYLNTINRWEVFWGGAGSGKSNFVAQKLAIQLSTMEGRNLLCLRKQAKDCRDSVFNEIRLALKSLNLIDLWQITTHPEPRMINRVNRNSIIFSGLDDVESIKSIKFESGNMTDCFVEEVSQVEDINDVREINRRLRDRKLKSRIVLVFNPISRTHWLHDFVTKELRMPGVDALLLRTTYKDNRFLPQDYIAELERLKYTDPFAYSVYALGQWGTMGQSVFNANKLQARLLELPNVVYKKAEFGYERNERGLFNPESTRIFYHADGEIKIFEEPQKNIPYVIAFDTAGEGSNYYAAHVMNNVTGNQAAVYHSLRDPSDCIIQIYGLGLYYNNALLCPEVNFDSYPLKKLLEWGYTSLYTRQTAVERSDEIYEKKYGFRTTSANRQQMLSELVAWVADNTHLLNDEDTIQEMLTFTRQQKKSKGIFWAAENGAHDDLCFVKGTLILTDKGQVPIEKIKIGDLVLTRDGFKPVEVATSSYKNVITKLGLTGTPNHPIITTIGEVPLDIVSDSDVIYMWNEQLSIIEEVPVWSAKQSFIMEKHIIDTQSPSADNLGFISGDTASGKNHHLRCTDKYGLTPLAKSLMDMLSTTKTGILSIIQSTILSVFRLESIVQITCNQKNEKRNLPKTENDKANDWLDNLESGEKTTPKKHTILMSSVGILTKKMPLKGCVNGEKKTQSLPNKLLLKMGEKLAKKDGERVERVYNLQIADKHEYFANNILVHNCMAMAITLQAREQQYCEPMPEKKEIKKGYYTDKELDMLAKEGHIDSITAKEMKIKSREMIGNYSSQVNDKRRKSRYAR